MSEPTTRPVVAVTVYGVRATAALQQVASLLGSAGVASEEVQELLALIQAGAVENAQGHVLDLTERPPEGSTVQAAQGWVAAVQAAARELAHIADCTVTQARPAARPTAPVSIPIPSSPTPVDHVPQELTERVLEAATRIFHGLTGRSGYSREMSVEILSVVLGAVSAEERGGYVAELESFAARNQGRLAELYRKYGPGGALSRLDRSGLTDQPESVVICERLDAAELWLEGVWDGELEESMLERFAQLWKFGCDTPRAPRPAGGR
ncbi:hypothetical protein [Streptomyces sasae]|uniref:hypothetical protein n=1 Tax=Streptomyces sasae TaxID=1266772 RepID=UPI00292FCE29|nr:hypothetical protein [Streptomyces sasae]